MTNRKKIELLIAGFFFSGASNATIIESTRFEIIGMDTPNEMIVETSILKTIMNIQEKIKLSYDRYNRPKVKQDYFFFSFAFDETKVFSGHVALTPMIKIMYSVDGGNSFHMHPVMRGGVEVPRSEYTSVRWQIASLGQRESVEVKVRYSYDYTKG